ncbi:PEMT/PEM2 family methyltransferase [Streptomyces ardesiacus]|uniref:PEMT/PEM2 family methyltransferase n=1 Tax=Streptomyces ardesiacus TaxID=285564 RepID=UPI00380C960F
MAETTEPAPAPVGSPSLHAAWRGLGQLAVAVIGMSGLRVDHPERRVLRTAVWACVVAAGFAAEQQFRSAAGSGALRWTAVGYAVVIAVLYYGGLIAVLDTAVARRFTHAVGEARAVRGFDFVLGLLFLQQGLCQGLLMAAFPGQLPEVGVDGLWVVLGVVLAAVGFGTKLWATWLTGLNTYYCRDMFLGRADATDGFVVRGPYRWLRNPMYGVGNLHGYGVALCYRSVAGLVCVAVFQVLIYVFYLVREKPFIVRTYLGGTRA